MCKTSNKATRLAIMAAQAQAEEQRRQNELLLQQQQKIHEENLRLQQEQLEFQRKQAEEIAKREEEMLKLAQRPTPLPADGSGTVLTGGMTELSGDEIKSRKRGRASLRIDLNAPQVAGSTGLNVPRG